MSRSDIEERTARELREEMARPTGLANSDVGSSKALASGGVDRALALPKHEQSSGSGIVTRELCASLRRLWDDGNGHSMQKLGRETGLDYRTVRTHVKDECKHARKHVGVRLCNTIRALAHDGMTENEISNSLKSMPSTRAVSRHAYGHCSCAAEIEPADPKTR